LSREESVENLAKTLAISSGKVLADSPDRAREAALLAIESPPPILRSKSSLAECSFPVAVKRAIVLTGPGIAQRVRDLAFSPDGAALVVARDDGSIQLFDVANHKSIGFFEPDEQPAAHIELAGDPQGISPDNNSAVSVAFNSSGSLLATGTRDGIAHGGRNS
jgi:WD40 repeat protein